MQAESDNKETLSFAYTLHLIDLTLSLSAVHCKLIIYSLNLKFDLNWRKLQSSNLNRSAASFIALGFQNCRLFDRFYLHFNFNWFF